MKSAIAYFTLWLLIGFISAIDIYWAIVLQDVILETEQNPLGRFLINISDGNIALFMCLKVVGLVVVLGILTLLYFYKKRTAWISILGVSIFQLWLLWYLCATGPSILSKAESYRKQEQKELQCLPTIIHADSAKTYLKQSMDSMTLPTPAQSAEEQNSSKSSTSRP